MKKLLLPLPIFLSAISVNALSKSTDVLIVGGGASGVTAAVQAARMGVSTMVVEESPWVGGMLTSAGVCAIDGNSNMKAGMWGEFFNALVDHYGSPEALMTGWVSNVQFEPSVGQNIMRGFLTMEENIDLLTDARLLSLDRPDGSWVAEIVNADGDTLSVKAKVVIDATELGDVARMVGVGYDVGMESRDVTGEDVAPATSNEIIQDLTYVAVLKDYGRDVTIARPEGYDPDDFACSAINPKCITPKEPDRMWPADKMITYGKLPGEKYMINWPVEGNDFYVNMIDLDREGREKAVAAAKNFTMCFVYFLQTELGFNTLGLADDEFPSDDCLPLIPYHRESRRIHGVVRYDLNDMCQPYEQKQPLYRTCIAVGDYPVDHHHARYTGYDSLPNLYFHPVPSFGLPLGTLIPEDVDGLIVAEKSISVSNLANGATRLQPVVLQIGQAAGAVAANAVKNNREVRDVPVRDVQDAILAAGGYLLPYLDCKPGDLMFAPLQRIGSVGLLRGESQRVGWTNETHVYPERRLTATDLQLLATVYPSIKAQLPDNDSRVTYDRLKSLIKEIARSEGIRLADKSVDDVIDMFVNAAGETSDDVPTRGVYAMAVDYFLDPFHRQPVAMTGDFVRDLPQKTDRPVEEVKMKSPKTGIEINSYEGLTASGDAWRLTVTTSLNNGYGAYSMTKKNDRGKAEEGIVYYLRGGDDATIWQCTNGKSTHYFLQGNDGNLYWIPDEDSRLKSYPFMIR